MRVGVISDTHLQGGSGRAAELVRLCDRHFAGIDTILHAGDLGDPALIELLLPREVIAVAGNVDSSGLPLSRILRLNRRRIGLIHGWGPAEGLELRVLKEFVDDDLDVLIFGHSHQPLCRRHDNLLLLNPGSVFEPRRTPCPSLAILDLGTTVRAEIIPLNASAV